MVCGASPSSEQSEFSICVRWYAMSCNDASIESVLPSYWATPASLVMPASFMARIVSTL